MFKILTHDYRPPIQGGEPVWDGKQLPFELPVVPLDISDAECGRGWNYTATLAEAFRITGLWPNGRPAACFTVEPSTDAITRGSKRRCSQLTLTGRVQFDAIRTAIRELSSAWFDDQHADRMIDSQCSWFSALGRAQPVNEQRIEEGLLEALEARGLDWQLKRYDTAWGAWGARGAWDARGAWGAWDARDARGAWDARDARGARGAWDAWDARGARGAWGALTVEYASLMRWVDLDPLKLTMGLRDAYEFGLVLAIPTEPNTLGWTSQP